MAKTYICDVMPGGGKSSALIKMMNEQVDKRFIYIAPYLDEGERIMTACKSRGFVSPTPKDSGGKIADLHRLLSSGRNIASTHALFERYNEETIALIKDGGYTLVMDEAFQIAKILAYTASDIRTMVSAGLVDTTGDRVKWVCENYEGGVFTELKAMIEGGYLQSFKNMFFYWYYPPEVFRAFDEVYVLTYMFSSQFLRYYFDINGLSYEYRWVDYIDGEYILVDYEVVPSHACGLKDKIHILDRPALNEAGANDWALSSTWYKKELKKHKKNQPNPKITALRNNINNYFKNIMRKRSDDVLWTTYGQGQDALSGKGYTKGFISYNARATNEYREKDTIAYMVNVFPNPDYVEFFRSRGCDVDGDGYALSEMIQLIWRSAIREGKDIWIYIPSKRMRTLLTDWLDELSVEE